MNEMVYFSSTNLNVEEIANLAQALGYSYAISSDEPDRITVFEDSDWINRISNWKRLTWKPEKWEKEIREILDQYELIPAAVFLVEFTALVLREMTDILKHLLARYGGIIYPSVVDNFILDKDNLTLDNMKSLYERDYPDI